MPGVIQLRTEIPGPASRALLARRAQAVPRGVPAVTPLERPFWDYARRHGTLSPLDCATADPVP